MKSRAGFILSLLVAALVIGFGASDLWAQTGTPTTPVFKAKPVLIIDPGLLQNASLPMILKKGDGELGPLLAMNIQYAPIPKIRENLRTLLKKPVDYFKPWVPEGAAQITVISPSECLTLAGPDPKNPLVTMDAIAEIAASNKLQESDLTILGLGSSMKKMDGKLESTFFLILKSENLLKIRRQVNDLFIQKGGSPGSFNPEAYHPNIAVGFTKRDLTETDGVIRNMEHSEDRRIKVEVGPTVP